MSVHRSSRYDDICTIFNPDDPNYDRMGDHRGKLFFDRIFEYDSSEVISDEVFVDIKTGDVKDVTKKVSTTEHKELKDNKNIHEFLNPEWIIFFLKVACNCGGKIVTGSKLDIIKKNILNSIARFPVWKKKLAEFLNLIISKYIIDSQVHQFTVNTSYDSITSIEYKPAYEIFLCLIYGKTIKPEYTMLNPLGLITSILLRVGKLPIKPSKNYETDIIEGNCDFNFNNFFILNLPTNEVLPLNGDKIYEFKHENKNYKGIPLAKVACSPIPNVDRDSEANILTTIYRLLHIPDIPIHSILPFHRNENQMHLLTLILYMMFTSNNNMLIDYIFVLDILFDDRLNPTGLFPLDINIFDRLLDTIKNPLSGGNAKNSNKFQLMSGGATTAELIKIFDNVIDGASSDTQQHLRQIRHMVTGKTADINDIFDTTIWEKFMETIIEYIDSNLRSLDILKNIIQIKGDLNNPNVKILLEQLFDTVVSGEKLMSVLAYMFMIIKTVIDNNPFLFSTKYLLLYYILQSIIELTNQLYEIFKKLGPRLKDIKFVSYSYEEIEQDIRSFIGTYEHFITYISAKNIVTKTTKGLKFNSRRDIIIDYTGPVPKITSDDVLKAVKKLSIKNIFGFTHNINSSQSIRPSAMPRQSGTTDDLPTFPTLNAWLPVRSPSSIVDPSAAAAAAADMKSPVGTPRSRTGSTGMVDLDDFPDPDASASTRGPNKRQSIQSYLSQRQSLPASSFAAASAAMRGPESSKERSSTMYGYKNIWGSDQDKSIQMDKYQRLEEEEKEEEEEEDRGYPPRQTRASGQSAASTSRAKLLDRFNSRRTSSRPTNYDPSKPSYGSGKSIFSNIQENDTNILSSDIYKNINLHKQYTKYSKLIDKSNKKINMTGGNINTLQTFETKILSANTASDIRTIYESILTLSHDNPINSSIKQYLTCLCVTKVINIHRTRNTLSNELKEDYANFVSDRNRFMQSNQLKIFMDTTCLLSTFEGFGVFNILNKVITKISENLDDNITDDNIIKIVEKYTTANPTFINTEVLSIFKTSLHTSPYIYRALRLILFNKKEEIPNFTASRNIYQKSSIMTSILSDKSNKLSLASKLPILSSILSEDEIGYNKDMVHIIQLFNPKANMSRVFDYTDRSGTPTTICLYAIEDEKHLPSTLAQLYTTISDTLSMANPLLNIDILTKSLTKAYKSNDSLSTSKFLTSISQADITKIFECNTSYMTTLMPYLLECCQKFSVFNFNVGKISKHLLHRLPQIEDTSIDDKPSDFFEKLDIGIDGVEGQLICKNNKIYMILEGKEVEMTDDKVDDLYGDVYKVTGITCNDEECYNKFLIDCINGSNIEGCIEFLKSPTYWDNVTSAVKKMPPHVMKKIFTTFNFKTEIVYNQKIDKQLKQFITVEKWLQHLKAESEKPSGGYLNKEDYMSIERNDKLLSYLRMLHKRITRAPCILNENIPDHEIIIPPNDPNSKLGQLPFYYRSDSSDPTSSVVAQVNAVMEQAVKPTIVEVIEISGGAFTPVNNTWKLVQQAPDDITHFWEMLKVQYLKLKKLLNSKGKDISRPDHNKIMEYINKLRENEMMLSAVIKQMQKFIDIIALNNVDTQDKSVVNLSFMDDIVKKYTALNQKVSRGKQNTVNVLQKLIKIVI